MKKTVLLTFVLALFVSFYSQAQDHHVSVSGKLGWASPGGDGVGNESGQLDVDGGLTYTVDALYHIMDQKLGLGVTYAGSILASVDDGLDAFGMEFYGVKGLYSLKTSGFSPYAALSLGLVKVSTPEVSQNGAVAIPSESGTFFGIMPTLGIDINGFTLSVDYLLPGNLSIDNRDVTDAKYGQYNFNLGYRRRFAF